ncbi:MAG: hypothetical protein WC254_03430, partial [Candidatus Woesearchaeota archaeon]
MTMPDELKLVRISLSDAVLYLYPEYVQKAGMFADFQSYGWRRKLGGTRGVSLVETKEGFYVAKPEREDGTYLVSKDLSKYLPVHKS